MKRVSAAVSMMVLSSSLMVGPSAHAVTPDDGSIVGGFWSTANTIKMYFDWRSWGGWGAVGSTNVLITIGTGASHGAITRAAFTAICGSTAAGFLARWKPADGPTAAATMKAVAKAGAVVAASSACGWVSQFAFNKIDAEYVRAHRAIEDAKMHNVPNYNEIVDDKARATNAHLGIEESYKRAGLALTLAKDRLDAYVRLGCETPRDSTACANLSEQRRAAQAEAELKVAQFNLYGAELSAQLKELAFDVKS